MNYYEHHLGDYAQATAHLSFLEDAAYSRLIRKYYASEKPIPADLAAAQRLVGARSKEERAAVETVLNEFFELRDDGWHQARCDAEIARYQDKQAKAQRSANARWKKDAQHTDRNADAMRTHTEGNAHQTPDTRHHSPDTKREEKRAPTGTRLPAGPLPDEFEAFCRQERPDLAPAETWDRFGDYWRAKPGKDGVKLDWFATWRNWVRGERTQPAARASPPVGKYANVMAALSGKAPQPLSQDFIDVESRTVASRLG